MSANTDLEVSYYKDTGCRAAPRCLECPLPECLYERTYSGIGLADLLYARRERDAEIVELYAQGMTPLKIARKFGISSRSVHRIVQRGGPSDATVNALEGDIPGKPLSAMRNPYRQRTPWPELRRTM